MTSTALIHGQKEGLNFPVILKLNPTRLLIISRKEPSPSGKRVEMDASTRLRKIQTGGWTNDVEGGDPAVQERITSRSGQNPRGMRW